MDWKNHFKTLSAQSKNHKILSPARSLPYVVFGAESSDTIKLVQQALNNLGFANPPLVVDGNAGPKTAAAVSAYQTTAGIAVDGQIGPQTLGALGIVPSSTVPVAKPTTGKSVTKSNYIATMVAALTQAAAEKGYTLSPGLASLMIGQLRGAEGAMPGLAGTLGGTNNMGAAQVTASLASAKKGLQGWGAFAHKDSDPNGGPYVGWYWIAPSPLEAARDWLGNWWGPKLLQSNPQDPTTYASILYAGGYYGGVHAGDTNHDPNSDAGKLNVADYASAISRGLPSAAELAMTPDDPSVSTVDPSSFAPLSARKITESLYTQAVNGGLGSAWKYLLPSSWSAMQSSNGVVWFGPAPAGIAAGIGTLIISLIVGLGTLAWWFLRKGA